MAASSEIKDIFGDSPAAPLMWAKAVLTTHRAGMDTEHKLAVEHGGAGEISAMAWSIHSQTLDAVHALISVAQLLMEEK